jgi:hypothetical protein
LCCCAAEEALPRAMLQWQPAASGGTVVGKRQVAGGEQRDS